MVAGTYVCWPIPAAGEVLWHKRMHANMPPHLAAPYLRVSYVALHLATSSRCHLEGCYQAAVAGLQLCQHRVVVWVVFAAAPQAMHATPTVSPPEHTALIASCQHINAMASLPR